MSAMRAQPGVEHGRPRRERGYRTSTRNPEHRQPRARVVTEPGFFYELSMLDRGAGIDDVLRSAFGGDGGGLRWQSAVRRLLAREKTPEARRGMLAHWLRWWSRPKKRGAQWRVADHEGFVGHRTELRHGVDIVQDPETGELFERTGKLRPHHVPACRAGGLAAYDDQKSPRQQDRYRFKLRDGAHAPDRGTRDGRGKSGPDAIVASRQPPADKSGAVMPKRQRDPRGRWAYGQSWLRLPPSAEMLRRWGERADNDPPSPHERLAGARDPSDLADVLHEIREARAELDEHLPAF